MSAAEKLRPRCSMCVSRRSSPFSLLDAAPQTRAAQIGCALQLTFLAHNRLWRLRDRLGAVSRTLPSQRWGRTFACMVDGSESGPSASGQCRSFNRTRPNVRRGVISRHNLRRKKASHRDLIGAGQSYFFESELGFGVSCFSSRTSSGKLSATNITAAVTSPTVIPNHQ
jgi:hypothetical protein